MHRVSQAPTVNIFVLPNRVRAFLYYDYAMVGITRKAQLLGFLRLVPYISEDFAASKVFSLLPILLFSYFLSTSIFRLTYKETGGSLSLCFLLSRSILLVFVMPL